MVEDFNLLNQYFDKIFVLHLPRLSERLTGLQKNLEGLHYEMFEGVDKNQVTTEELTLKGLYDRELYRRLYPGTADMHTGMLCCALGHVNIYKKIIEKGYNKTLILEDDITVSTEALKQFTSIVNELPADWELLYLGYEKNEHYGLKEKFKKLLYYLFPPYSNFTIHRKYISRYYPVILSPHIARAGFHDCTHAYAVTLNGARKLLSHQQPVHFHPDNLLSHMACTGEIKAYIARPKIFGQLSAFNKKIDSLTSG